jgi:hypothetical protein
LKALGDPAYRISNARPFGNDVDNKGVVWPWVSSGHEAFVFRLAELPLAGGVRPLRGTEGPHKLTCSDSSGDMTYRGVNDRGVFVPGTFMVWTGGGHDVWAGSEVYAVGPLERDPEEGIEGLQYRRLVDPSIPPLHISHIHLPAQRPPRGNESGTIATWDWDANGEDRGMWVAGQGLPATPFAAEDGGVGSWHSYSLACIHPTRNVLFRTNSGDYQLGGRDNFAELDLGTNHRRTRYDARGLPAANPGGAEWRIRTRDLSGLSTGERSAFANWLINRCGTEYCNGHFWTGNNRWWSPAGQMVLRSGGGAGDRTAIVRLVVASRTFASWGNSGDQGMTLVAAENRRRPEDGFDFMFAYREGDLVDHMMYWLDVADAERPTLGPVTWTRESAGPRHESPQYALKGGVAWDWEERCFWCYTVPVSYTGAPWKIYTHVYRFSVPGITRGYLPKGDYRTDPWRSERIDAASGGDPLYPATFYEGGTGTWKNFRFTPAPIRGLFWHGTADQPIRFFRLPA